MGKAKEAARALKILFDRKPAIDSWSEDGEKLESMDGSIEFRDGKLQVLLDLHYKRGLLTLSQSTSAIQPVLNNQSFAASI